MRNHLKNGVHAEVRLAQGLGARVMTNGLTMLDLAEIHQEALLDLMPPKVVAVSIRNGIIEDASAFFAKVITPIISHHRVTLENNVRLNRRNRILNRRTSEMSAANRRLKREIAQRKAAQESLKKSQLRYSQLLGRSQNQPRAS
ncbi:hypothetical protein HY256_09710 [Candidatus Sumerlaeota bacterium]|nr:hypothetical protein [Candidatus Sumerlaeota bacterium]